MKHPSNRALFAYWQRQRGVARAPRLDAIDPRAIRNLLGDGFVASNAPEAGWPLRLAGTRVCALFQRLLQGEPLAGLFTSDAAPQLARVAAICGEELLPVVAGLSAADAPLEMLLLPTAAARLSPPRLIGTLVALDRVAPPLPALTITSWRVLDVAPDFRPRSVRRRAVGRGFVIYEGARQS